jgi:signal transduction histidine kinase/CheY-like chemotaxis protein
VTRHVDTNCRVLIFAPIGRDAELTHELLGREGIATEIFRSVTELTAAIAGGAAALIVTEELFEHDGVAPIAAALRAQPPWSDIAVLLFAGPDGSAVPGRTIEANESFPNVTRLDRPIRVAVAVSIVRAAIRARLRQLELRDLLVQLEAAREEAEAASRLKDEFLATLSHELRTPLNAIIGWTAMLRHGELDQAQVRRGLEVIDRNARSQVRLVEDVLDIARVITGKLRLELKPVSLTSIIESAVEALRPAAEAKWIRMETVRTGATPLVNGDAARLQQVLWNLLSNAVKFTPEGGGIAVRIETSGSHVRVSVTDTGMGIDAQFLPFVFDRFRQADQSVTRGHGGLGLGLAIVKHLVELHGGTVRVSSDGLGKGATFVLDFPVAAELVSGVGTDTIAPNALGRTFAHRRILIVDDDETTREMLAELLGRAEALVTTAESAARALAAIQETTPDVIIADIGLPGEDGCSLIRRIRSLPTPAASVPAIALSAYTRYEDRERALASGFTDFIGKPADPADLITVVQRVMAPAPSHSTDALAGDAASRGGDDPQPPQAV